MAGLDHGRGREAAIAGSSVPTGWGDANSAFAGAADAGGAGGLARGAIHEWLTSEPAPPLCVLAHLARQAARGRAGLVVWIGGACWPWARALEAGDPAPERSPRARSLFIATGTLDERVWAIDLALRCRGVCAVVGDASGMGMSASRRFQLAASAGGTLGLLARPLSELKELSAARTRWTVAPVPVGGADVGGADAAGEPCWRVELIRNKGAGALEGQGQGHGRAWTLRRDHASGDVRVVGDAPDRRPAAAAEAAGTGTRRTA